MSDTIEVDDEQDFEKFREQLIDTFDSSPSSLKCKNVIAAHWWRQWCDFNNIAVQKPIELVNEIVNEIRFKAIELPNVEESFNIDIG